MNILINEIVNFLKSPEYQRTLTVGPRDDPKSVSYVLLQEDIDKLEKALLISDILDMVPIEKWIAFAVKEYKKNQ